MIAFTVLFACRDNEEPLSCEFNGETYSVGEWFDAPDGCNSCSCDAYEGETTVSCTEMACDTGFELVEDTGNETTEETGTETDSDTNTDTNSDTNQDTDSDEPADCTELSVAECASADECTVITSSQVEYDQRNECYTWSNNVERVGCMAADMGCGSAFTYAAAPDNPSQCYGFTNTCVPQGWVDCEQVNIGECN